MPIDLATFSYRFATLTAAGIPLVPSLLALEKQEENEELRKAISAVRNSVEGGILLSEALAQNPKIFSPFFVSLIYAGEQGTGLAKVLNRLTDHLEKEAVLRSRVKEVFIYPLVVGTLALLVITFLVIAVVPVFDRVYAQLGVTLPLITRILLNLSMGIRRFWWIIFLLIGFFYFVFRRLSRKGSPQKEWLNWLMIKIPIFGQINQKMALAKFMRSFADLTLCGISLLDSLKVAERVTEHPEITKLVENASPLLQAGNSLTETLALSNIFPSTIIQMIAVGEESGALGEMLEKGADLLDQDVVAKVKKAMTTLEPSLIFILALVVAFIAFAVYLPMFDLVRLISP